jgi:hypothetical protein
VILKTSIAETTIIQADPTVHNPASQSKVTNQRNVLNQQAIPRNKPPRSILTTLGIDRTQISPTNRNIEEDMPMFMVESVFFSAPTPTLIINVTCFDRVRIAPR